MAKPVRSPSFFHPPVDKGLRNHINTNTECTSWRRANEHASARAERIVTRRHPGRVGSVSKGESRSLSAMWACTMRADVQRNCVTSSTGTLSPSFLVGFRGALTGPEVERSRQPCFSPWRPSGRRGLYFRAPDQACRCWPVLYQTWEHPDCSPITAVTQDQGDPTSPGIGSGVGHHVSNNKRQTFGRFSFPVDVLFVLSFLGCGYILTVQQAFDCLPKGAWPSPWFCRHRRAGDKTNLAPISRVFEARQWKLVVKLFSTHFTRFYTSLEN